MKVNTKHLTRYACSTVSSVAVIGVIVASSAMPVKSDAFAINSAHHIGTTALMQKTIKLNNYPQRSPPRTELALEKGDSELYVGSRTRMHDAADVVKLRGGSNSASSMMDKISAYVSKNFFLLGMIFAVSFAKLFPELGKNGSALRPELFIGKYGVTTIFLLSGISLKLQELTNAVSNMKLNGLIQFVTFGAWPYLVGLPMTKGIELLFPGLLPTPLIEGLLILCCLPTTINMCIILTSAAGGSGEYLYLLTLGE